MKSWQLKNKPSAGFTLIEMLVVAPIAILLIGTIIYAIVQLTGDALAERSSAVLINEIHSSLERIETDTKLSGAFLAQNNMTLTSPQGSDDGTANFTSVTSGDDVLILNSFVTTASPSDSTRSLVYLADMPNACNSDNLEQNQVMTMNTVYFTKPNANGVTELWRRTLAVSGYTGEDCSGVTPWQRPSCSPGLTGSLCATQDELLVSGVTDFEVRYYDVASDSVRNWDAEDSNTTTRQTAMDETDTIQVTLKAEQTVAGRPVTGQGTIRVSRVGSLIKYATP